MHLSPALIADLKIVSEALDDPLINLPAMLETLISDLEAAVASLVGVEIIMRIGDLPVSLVVSAYTDSGPVEVDASLLLPIFPAESTNSGSLIVYAAVSGALIDLAEDTQSLHSMQRPLSTDLHLLPTPPDATGIRGLQDLLDVNQAFGVLTEQGHDEPSTELKGLATLSRQSTPMAARRVLAVLGGPPISDLS